MTGPKHLWSGDWERESAASRRSARVEPPSAAEPVSRAPARAPRDRSTHGSRRLAMVLTVLVLGVAGAAYGVLTATRSHPHANAASPDGGAPITVTAPARTFAVPTRTGTGPSQAAGIRQTLWLGLTLVTGVVGHADVESVAVPSAGEHAGVRAGDEILAVGAHPVSGSASLTRALRGLHTGERLILKLARGAVTRRLPIILGASSNAAP